jgi:hypothetical protein
MALIVVVSCDIKKIVLKGKLKLIKKMHLFFQFGLNLSKS